MWVRLGVVTASFASYSDLGVVDAYFCYVVCGLRYYEFFCISELVISISLLCLDLSRPFLIRGFPVPRDLIGIT